MAEFADDNNSYEVDSFPENPADYENDNLGAPPGAGMQQPIYDPGPANVDLYNGGVEMGDEYADDYRDPQGEALYGNPSEPYPEDFGDRDGQSIPEVNEYGDLDPTQQQAPPPPVAAGVGDAGQFPEDYVEAFQIYDKEYGDDAISAGMLGTVLRALGQNPTEGQLAELVQTMGKDIYTVADVDFILRNYDLRDQCSGTEIKDMWEMVAGPGQTFVQKSVLQAVLSKVGDKIFEQDFAKIMMAADVGGDVVTFDQFERIMTH